MPNAVARYAGDIHASKPKTKVTSGMNKPWTDDEIKGLVGLLGPKSGDFGFTLGSGEATQVGTQTLTLFFEPKEGIKDDNYRGVIQWLTELWGPGDPSKQAFNPSADRDEDDVHRPPAAPRPAFRNLDDEVVPVGEDNDIQARARQVIARAQAAQRLGQAGGVPVPPAPNDMILGGGGGGGGNWAANLLQPEPMQANGATVSLDAPPKKFIKFKYTFYRSGGDSIVTILY